MLQPGTSAPDFELPDAHGTTYRLGDVIANGPLILYFYPADFTPGCTKEACQIRDIHDDITKVGLTVIGVSPQDGDTHRRFADKFDLPFPLLCDPDKIAITAYDVDGPFGMGTRRATFLIGQDGNILDAVLADVRIERHAAFIEKAIAERANAAAS
ncbi:MAG: peroxiredoxin [Pseudomonadota bacterium]